MASLTPAPTSMIDRLEKYLLSCLQGENIEKIQICSKKHFIYVGNFQTLFIQNYIAIFSEEDPFYRTHNSEIGNRISKPLVNILQRFGAPPPSGKKSASWQKLSEKS